MIIMDSSFFLSRIFGDEENPLVMNVFNEIENAKLEVLAPNLFFYEIHNSLVTAARRNRILKSEIAQY